MSSESERIQQLNDLIGRSVKFAVGPLAAAAFISVQYVRGRLHFVWARRLSRGLTGTPLPDVVAASGRSESGTVGLSVLLGLMQAKGLFSRYALQTTMGSGTDEFDAGDWEAGGSTQWMYIVSGSALVGGSQLAQDRTAATGRGAGLYPGQLLTAPRAVRMLRACGYAHSRARVCSCARAAVGMRRSRTRATAPHMRR